MRQDDEVGLCRPLSADFISLTPIRPNAFFANLGLFTMSEVHKLARQS